MIYYDWTNGQLLDEAIETIDPFKITVRSRPVIIVGPTNVGYMSM